MRFGGRGRALVAAAVVLVGAVAWGGSALASPSLHLPGAGTSACMQGRTDATFGVTQLDHGSGEPIIVTAVTAPSTGDVRLVDAFVVRYDAGVTNPVRFGTGEWPIAARWGRAEPAVGASVPAGQAADLLVHLRRVADGDGSIGPVRVEFVQGAHRYSETTVDRLSLRTRC